MSPCYTCVHHAYAPRNRAILDKSRGEYSRCFFFHPLRKRDLATVLATHSNRRRVNGVESLLVSGRVLTRPYVASFMRPVTESGPLSGAGPSGSAKPSRNPTGIFPNVCRGNLSHNSPRAYASCATRKPIQRRQCFWRAVTLGQKSRLPHGHISPLVRRCRGHLIGHE